eukprot:4741-Heterococcus_DN1.PRE.2
MKNACVQCSQQQSDGKLTKHQDAAACCSSAAKHAESAALIDKPFRQLVINSDNLCQRLHYVKSSHRYLSSIGSWHSLTMYCAASPE